MATLRFVLRAWRRQRSHSLEKGFLLYIILQISSLEQVVDLNIIFTVLIKRGHMTWYLGPEDLGLNFDSITMTW